MIACVQIKYFAAAVARAADPMLLGVPVILVRYTKERGRVAAVSSEAEQAGVQPGMALSRARAVCPGGCFLMLDAQRADAALDALLEVLWTFTHQVEIDETAYPQTVVAYLDLGRLNPDDLAAAGRADRRDRECQHIRRGDGRHRGRQVPGIRRRSGGAGRAGRTGRGSGIRRAAPGHAAAFEQSDGAQAAAAVHPPTRRTGGDLAPGIGRAVRQAGTLALLAGAGDRPASGHAAPDAAERKC